LPLDLADDDQAADKYGRVYPSSVKSNNQAITVFSSKLKHGLKDISVWDALALKD